MEEVRHFLESSTIHGLAYISTISRCSLKFFWTLVVIAGFTGAGVLIYQSFEDWSDNPIKTTIETRPITEITFPKVTVCPPQNTFTDLNFDLVNTDNITHLNESTRNNLILYAVELLHDHVFDTLMENISQIQDHDRYFNWYQGYSGVSLPQQGNDEFVYKISTHAPNGTIFTKHFDEKFNLDKIIKRIRYDIEVFAPSSIETNRNVTLHFKIEKVQISNSYLSIYEGHDNLIIGEKGNQIGASISENFTAHYPHYIIGYTGYSGFKRHVSQVHHLRYAPKEALKTYKLDQMPGFKLTWYYTGIDQGDIYMKDYMQGLQWGASRAQDRRRAFVRHSFS